MRARAGFFRTASHLLYRSTGSSGEPIASDRASAE